MANFYTILTSYGKQAIANAEATGTPINLKYLAVGDGNGQAYQPNEEQTTLRNEVYRTQINRIAVDTQNTNWVVIEAVIPANVGGFTIREIGVFDNNNNLVLIGNYPDTYKPVLTEGSGNDLYIRVIMRVSNTSTVQLKIDPAIVLATIKTVDDKISQHNTDTTAHSDIRQKIQDILAGNVIVSNSDKLDGYHASTTPSANAIPVADSTGKIALGWMPTSSTYSRMTVGTSYPTNPNHNDLFWNSSTLKLYRYDAVSSSWIEIDWKTIVKASPEFIAGRLRINSSSGQLEISPDGTNWYACIPAVGSSAVEITTLDNTNFSYKYWIAPGQTAIIRNANHVPIVYTQALTSFWEISTASPSDTQILVSNIAVSHTVQYTQWAGTVNDITTENHPGIRITNASYISEILLKLSTANVFYFSSHWSTTSTNNYLRLEGSNFSIPSTAYWLGACSPSVNCDFVVKRLS